ncbi:hypothetical protein DM860_009531 [Cuscuta australis]|uniref:F-box/LRR-repeat protein 15/At3g58940/PEG3-like LRR domain-containing protein n=1 Tax=Cuscuta australis TaxID=267555 RepID=A0A328DJ89_9ASTE|nr:hypothetical protein DM860_009531 [Cuscuta australis]
MQMRKNSKRIKLSLCGHVEEFPLEVIGDILSRVRVARDVIKASLTCKKWREAYRKHLHALSLEASHIKAFYGRYFRRAPDVELSISKMIFESPGLQKLSIRMCADYKFPVSLVVAWLMFVRENLLELFYEDTTSFDVNVLYIFKMQRLETLSLCDYKIKRVKPNSLRFPYLTSLTLCRVGIPVHDLNRFLHSFPKLERLKLDAPFPHYPDDMSFSQDKVLNVLCPTLKMLFLDNLKLFKFILEKSSVEHLQVKRCYFVSLKVFGDNTLRGFKMSCSKVRLLAVKETDNVESFEIINSHFTESNWFPMAIRSPNLKNLKTFRFWGFKQPSTCPAAVEGIFPNGSRIVLDFKQMAICLPQLSHLAMLCEGVDGLVYRFGGSTSLEKVVVLEMGCDGSKRFGKWAEKLLKCCPNAKKVIVHWVFPEGRNSDHLKDLSKQSTSMVEMMMKYRHIQWKIAYMYDSDY